MNFKIQTYRTLIYFSDEIMPLESPYLYGLHPNAEIGFLTTTSENLFRTVFEMQPRDAGASGGATVTPEEKVIWTWLQSQANTIIYLPTYMLHINLCCGIHSGIKV